MTQPLPSFSCSYSIMFHVTRPVTNEPQFHVKITIRVSTLLFFALLNKLRSYFVSLVKELKFSGRTKVVSTLFDFRLVGD